MNAWQHRMAGLRRRYDPLPGAMCPRTSRAVASTQQAPTSPSVTEIALQDAIARFGCCRQ